MHTLKRIFLLLLAVTMLISGGAFLANAEETADRPLEFTLTETVLPEKDAATGTLKFYFGDKEIYAGAPVSQLLDLGVTAIDDLRQTVEPWNMTGVLRVRVLMDDGSNPFLFFVAMNASSQPKKVADCMIYSITINTAKGVRFGSGKEDVPFVTGETELDDILDAYGEPSYNKSGKDQYREIAYYEPFSCAYFSFKYDVVRQVTTYYSANVLGSFAADFTHDLGENYYGNDAYILMSRYMDVTPYLPGAKDKVSDGVVEELSESIMLDGKEVELGMRVDAMPSPFKDQFLEQPVYLNKKHYARVGRNLGEEFYFINLNGQTKNKKKDPCANALIVKGVFTENKNYSNWGKDNSKFFEFAYEDLTQDSTIEEILENYGMPYDMEFTSYARYCFVWLHYKDEDGNKLDICVDPMLNQLIELRVNKYFEGELFYD